MGSLRVYGVMSDEGGCGKYRIVQPLDQLAQTYGATVQYSTTMHLEHLRKFDVVIGQRVAQPAAVELWCRLAAMPNRPKMIFELDDDLWHIHPSNTNAYRFYTRPILAGLQRAITASDAVTVSTVPLQKILAHFHDRVYVVPNYIDAALLSLPSSGSPRAVERRIGWGGSYSHLDDIEASRNAIVAAVRDTNSWFTVIGPEFKFPELGDRYKYLKGTNNLRDYHTMLSTELDIGIAPLNQNKFNESKSYLKLLEYMALGIPSVVSDATPYQGIGKHGKTTLLSKTPKALGNNLKRLIVNKELQDTIRDNGRDVASQHTIQKNCHKYMDVYEMVLNSDR